MQLIESRMCVCVSTKECPCALGKREYGYECQHVCERAVQLQSNEESNVMWILVFWNVAWLNWVVPFSVCVYFLYLIVYLCWQPQKIKKNTRIHKHIQCKKIEFSHFACITIDRLWRSAVPMMRQHVQILHDLFVYVLCIAVHMDRTKHSQK